MKTTGKNVHYQLNVRNINLCLNSLVGKNALIDKLTTNIIQSAYGFPMHLIRAQRVKIVTEAFKTALQAGQALTAVWMS